MDHFEAVAAGMVERYVLGELSGAERDAFEEHYFSCRTCSSELRAALDVIEGVRKDGAQNRPPRDSEGQPGVGPLAAELPARARNVPSSGIYRQWGAWAAMLAVSVVAGYQGLVQVPGLRSAVRELEQPRLLAGTTVLRMGSRAAKAGTSGHHAGQPLQFFLEIPTEEQFKEYQVRITAPEGIKSSLLQVSASQARDNIILVIPKAFTGTYRVAVLGYSGQGEARLLEESVISVQ